jgi:hypothetical protein
MRWIALWLLLTATLLVGWLVFGLVAGRDLALDREALAHLAAIPAVQTLALWVVRFVRRAGS